MLKHAGDGMPTIHQIGNIKIQIYFERENPPHIHIYDRGYRAKIRIRDGTVMAGRLRNRSQRLVTRWLEENRDFALAKWNEFYQVIK